MLRLRTSAGFVVLGVLTFWVLDTVGTFPPFGKFTTEWFLSGDRERLHRLNIRWLFARGLMTEGAFVVFFCVLLRNPDGVFSGARLRLPAFFAACALIVHIFIVHFLLQRYIDAEGTTSTFHMLNFVQGTLTAAALTTFFVLVIVRSASEARVQDNMEMTTRLRLPLAIIAMAVSVFLIFECMTFVVKFSPAAYAIRMAGLLRDLGLISFFSMVIMTNFQKPARNR